VAIHGLNGDAYTTWEHENGTLWLRDLLPDTLPGSRVYTYGYPSGVFWSNSVAGLRDFSQHLLECLANISIGKRRPIILVCHSLGGIVCKQVRRPTLTFGMTLTCCKALVLAHRDDSRYGDLLSSITSIVFFGTPHRGSKLADVGGVVGEAVRMIIDRSVRTDLLTALQSNSPALEELTKSCQDRLSNVDILTFYETEFMAGLSQLVRSFPDYASYGLLSDSIPFTDCR